MESEADVVNVPGTFGPKQSSRMQFEPNLKAEDKAPLFTCLMSRSGLGAIDVSLGFLIYGSSGCAECGLPQNSM
jgi:hypothetical protein